METLRSLRAAKELSLEEAAKEISIDPSNLSRIERGIQQPSRETIESMAKFYEKTIGEIYVLAFSRSDKSAA